jgi:hypothetical protein
MVELWNFDENLISENLLSRWGTSFNGQSSLLLFHNSVFISNNWIVSQHMYIRYFWFLYSFTIEITAYRFKSAIEGTLQTVKIFLFKLSKFSFSNCQNFPFQTVKNFLFKLSKFPFQTVKIFLFKLSKFPFQTVKIFLYVRKFAKAPHSQTITAPTSPFIILWIGKSNFFFLFTTPKVAHYIEKGVVCPKWIRNCILNSIAWEVVNFMVL